MNNKYAFILVVLLCHSCNERPQEQHYHISEIEDTTDIHLLKCNAATILWLCDFASDPSKAVTFRKRYITDRKLSAITLIPLEAESATKASNTNDYIYFREQEIEVFSSKLKHAYAQRSPQESETKGLKNSECFYTIGQELEYLSNATGTKKVCLIYSNLYENGILSFYKNGTVDMTDTAFIQKVLEETYLLPESLAGLEVYFLYKPLNRTDDINYMTIATEYKKFLESKGAIVVIQASNNF